jgi:hypothetical protein
VPEGRLSAQSALIPGKQPGIQYMQIRAETGNSLQLRRFRARQEKAAIHRPFDHCVGAALSASGSYAQVAGFAKCGFLPEKSNSAMHPKGGLTCFRYLGCTETIFDGISNEDLS